MANINLHVDRERVGERITVDDYLGMQDGDLKAAVETVSKFVVDDDGEYLSYEEGRRLVGKIPMDDLPAVVEEFNKALRNSVSPPEKGSA